jgi:hypothetical protein
VQQIKPSAVAGGSINWYEPFGELALLINKIVALLRGPVKV